MGGMGGMGGMGMMNPMMNPMMMVSCSSRLVSSETRETIKLRLAGRHGNDEPHDDGQSLSPPLDLDVSLTM